MRGSESRLAVLSSSQEASGFRRFTGANRSSTTLSQKMDLRPITPKWARFLVIPGILFLVVLGIGLVITAVRMHGTNGIPETVLLASFGVAILLVAARGGSLVRSLSVRAAIEGTTLRIQRDSSSEVHDYPISELQIEEHPFLQLIHVRHAAISRALFTVDYFYSEGMALIARLKQTGDNKSE